ncbi:hypothetical protein [Alkalilimnicola ehrlichii]|uniref:hypothetical protein n=1 Tax=Alkalilimnicola ehrlichii TaxID=351052 RepID=UPI003BA172B1
MADEQQPGGEAGSSSEEIKGALLYGLGMVAAALALLLVRWLLVAAGLIAGEHFWEGVGITAAFVFVVMVVGGTVYGLLADLGGWLRGRDASVERRASE